MKLYELTYLIPPEVPENELKNQQEKITAFIQKEGGVLFDSTSSVPIKRKLAYPIKKRAMAYLISRTFQFEPKKLRNLEKDLKEDGRILRYLILSKKIIKEVPGRLRLGEVPAKRPGPKKIVPISAEKKPERKEKIKITKPKKVELKEIEKKLEEILGH